MEQLKTVRLRASCRVSVPLLRRIDQWKSHIDSASYGSWSPLLFFVCNITTVHRNPLPDLRDLWEPTNVPVDQSFLKQMTC